MSKKKVFISYSRADSDYVSGLVDALRSKGFDVWFDKNIRSGNEWDNTIEREIKNADAMVLILSDTSVQSDNVKDEMSYAMQLSKSVIPIKIEECDVPMRLARKQFIDFTQVGFDPGVNRLVDDISHALDTPVPEVSTPKATQETLGSTASETIQPGKASNITQPKEDISRGTETTPHGQSSGKKKKNPMIYILGVAVIALAVWGISSISSGGEHDMMAMCKADWEEMETAVANEEEELDELAALEKHIELYAPCPHETEAMDRISFLKAMGSGDTREVSSTDDSASMSNANSSDNSSEDSGIPGTSDIQEEPAEIIEEVIEEAEVDGNNVTQVNYSGGVFKQTTPKLWVEENENGERLWTVVRRNKDAVFLREGSDVKIKLDISNFAIFYSDANTEPFQLYTITEYSTDL
ncbi:MAG: toll/interleukin-1 receptor domain-containing protein [Bacteroidia bacterium]|nr:toll/interleukin-1 receptor domain-containing protein [Bacteroidia bacterium]